MVRTARLQHAMVVLFMLLVLGYGAIALPTIWRGSENVLDHMAATIGVALLIGVGVLVLTAGGLAWLLPGTLDRQHRSLTDQRHREDNLKEQSALLQSTLENMGEGLSVFDRHGRLVAWNSRFLELLDFSLPTRGTLLRDILLFQARRGDFGPGDPEDDVNKRLERFYRNVPSQREWTSPSGRILHIRRRAMPDGAVVSVYSDITERKASEEKMAQAWQTAELANRSKSDFLANMSHELRTPLNAIIGFSDMLALGLTGELPAHRLDHAHQLEYARIINQSGQHLLDIVNDLLDLAKIDAGKFVVEAGETDPYQLANLCAEFVGEAAQAAGLRLAVECEPGLPPVIADERRLKQVLLNLLTNSIKFTGSGGSVVLAVRRAEDGGIVFDVRDTGIGMTPEEISIALQPFGQLDSGLNRRHEGTGLGLPLARSLVELNGGTLEIRSEKDRGTTVTVRLAARRSGGTSAVTLPIVAKAAAA
jgi:signal transduction histidine kinase